MKHTNWLVLFSALCILSSCAEKESNEINSLRAPAWPLISIDTYTSAWSMSDNLYDSSVKHWTGKDFPFIGGLQVDGEIYRFMGIEDADLVTVVPTAQEAEWTGRFTEKAPSSNWMKPEFNDSGWNSGVGAFGTPDDPFARTKWESRNIWVRREVEINPEVIGRQVYLTFSNDDRAVFYINGVQIHDTGNNCNHDAIVPLGQEAASALKPGRNIIAASCENPVGLAILDFGISMAADPVSALNKTATQLSADVQATRTIYKFDCGPVELELTFMAPLFLDNLDLLSRPVNYISYSVKSKDGAKHNLKIYFEASPLWATDKPWQETESSTYTQNNIVYLKTGTTAQNILARKGDDIRIDWGYFYLAAEADGTEGGVGNAYDLRNSFKTGKALSEVGSAGSNKSGRLALTRDLGNSAKANGKVMLGYDDIYSIQYFEENLRPWWNQNGDKTIESQFEAALSDYNSLKKKCVKFDAELMTTAEKAGGRKYAELCALAYRQSIHAHKLVKAPNGDILWLSKENNSNGSIGTVDITYPSSPLYLLYNPTLAEGLMNHIYYYSESGRWKKPFPSHDVGTYPIANGQTYGGDMPVEEAGNMIILTAAVTRYEGNTDYAKKHWNTLTTWVQYLEQFGLDPESQLCTDDFAGHFAHNANLSIKAILAIASYSYMADKLGLEDVATEYKKKAQSLAAEWIEMDKDGDHYKLTFDKSGTWSQKYNLVWDQLLELDIFPDSVKETELAYYKTKQNRYGLPLDSRSTYTKTDWIVWTATMADSQEEFEEFIAPVHLFMNETEDRIPMSDWVYTDKPIHSGFKARSVVGGYFIKMLEYVKNN